jgi:hypothetical protein
MGFSPQIRSAELNMKSKAASGTANTR